MSASSSSNTGPNRFRGDAASFSPQQPNYQNYRPNQPPPQQQFYNPHHQQMYMNYGVPIYPYQIPPPFFYPPTEYYQPTQYPPAIHPQQHRYVNKSFNQHNVNIDRGNVNGSTSGNTSGSTGGNSGGSTSNGHGNSHGNGHGNVNYQPDAKQSSRENTQSINGHVSEKPSGNSHHPEPNSSSTGSSQNNEKIKPVEDKKPVKSITKKQEYNFPIFINQSKASFMENYPKLLNQRKLVNSQKLNQLNKLTSTDPIQKCIQPETIVDFNNSNPHQSEVVNTKSSSSSTSPTLLSNASQSPQSIQSPTLPSTNWASILQQTVPQSKQTTTKAKSPQATSTSNVNNQPVTEFNILQESSQPLGILLLRIMFDPNYSVFSSKLSKFPITPHGLLNTGNICYMNAILQILIFCQPFNVLFKLIHDKSLGSLNKESETPLIDTTIKFFQEFIIKNNSKEELEKIDQPYEDNKPISPDSFYVNLINHKKFQHLKWGQQEDAEEFLGYYLDGLNEEFVNSMKKLTTSMIDGLIQNYSSNMHDSDQVSKFKYSVKNTIKIIKNENINDSNDGDDDNDDNEWNEVGVNNKKISINKPVEFEPTPINQIFGGLFKSVLTIPKSTTSSSFQKSITVDPFQNIQLDISEVETIEDAFINLNKLEKISYKSLNNQEVSIKKQTFIDKLPRVLIIHLKRFSFLNEKDRGIEKLRHKIDYYHDLEIPSIVLSNKSLETVYRLTGVVYHHGISATGGHYTCDVLNDNEKGENWIRIDDTVLKLITQDEVLNGGNEENIKNAYLLFYERVENDFK